MERALRETDRRREKQHEYNEAHGITPTTIKRNIADVLADVSQRDSVVIDTGDEDVPHIVGHYLRAYIEDLERRMGMAAGDLVYAEAGRRLAEIRRLQDDGLGTHATRKQAQLDGPHNPGHTVTRKTQYDSHNQHSKG